MRLQQVRVTGTGHREYISSSTRVPVRLKVGPPRDVSKGMDYRLSQPGNNLREDSTYTAIPTDEESE
jgi:hypothetical protein